MSALTVEMELGSRLESTTVDVTESSASGRELKEMISDVFKSSLIDPDTPSDEDQATTLLVQGPDGGFTAVPDDAVIDLNQGPRLRVAPRTSVG